MRIEDVIDCFNDLITAFYRGHEGYTNTWYDVDNDEVDYPTVREYTIEIPNKDGDLYISVESYSDSTIPYNCIEEFSKVDVALSLNTKYLGSTQ